MLTMTARWHDCPQWIRGWFIGNLAFVFLALLVQLINFLYPNPSEQLEWLLIFLMPALPTGATASQAAFHSFWCAFDALCVVRWEEKVGTVVLLMIFAILKLSLIGWFIYALSHMTIF